MTARNVRGNGGNCVSVLTRPVEWLDARDLKGRPGKLPLSGRREMRNPVGMHLLPEEDALMRLLPYHGLDSKDASGDFGGGWMTGRRQLTRGKGPIGLEEQSPGGRLPMKGRTLARRNCVGAVQARGVRWTSLVDKRGNCR